MIKIQLQMVQKTAVILLILLSMVFGVFRLFVAPGDYIKDAGFVEKWDANIKVVKSKIPPDTKKMGYVSDLNAQNVTQEERALERNELLLTRYSMAPVVVVPGGKYEWIIGNFTNPAYKDILKENIQGPFTVEKLRRGIFLIHRGK